MTGSLKTAIADIALSRGGWRSLPGVPPHITRSLAILEKRTPDGGGGRGDPEGDRAFLQRAAARAVADLSVSEARRALLPAWRDLVPEDGAAERAAPNVTSEWVRALTERLVMMGWRPADRRLALTWLDVFPCVPPGDFLSQAARIAAERHAWPLRDAGKRLQLWDAESGPRALGKALLAGDPAQVLSDAALSARPDAGIVRAAVDRIADDVASAGPANAARDVTALLDLLAALPGNSEAPFSPGVVHGLMAPWLDRAPPAELKRRLQTLLLARIGDPRFQGGARWASLAQAMAARGHPNASRVEGLMRQWLIGEAFELFFKLLADTTGNAQQWQRRERYWRRYLDAGRISNAWFILGNDAAHWARGQGDRLKRGQYGRLNAGADADQSALLMRISDLTIAEWSNDGSCCFWKPDASEMPQFGAQWLDGKNLRASRVMEALAARDRARTGQYLWQAIGHRGAGWETRFDNAIVGRW